MSEYHAEVINLSLINTRILKNYHCLSIRKRFLGLLKIYEIAVPEENIEKTASLFQANMGYKLKKEWYITFHNADTILVVFRHRIFHLSGIGINPIHYNKLNTDKAEDKEKWDEMISYAKSLGVPDDQCDFLPEDFARQDY